MSHYQTRRSSVDNRSSSSSSTALLHRGEPGIIGKKIPVPVDQITAGHPTNLPRTEDSPETLDEALSQRPQTADSTPDE